MFRVCGRSSNYPSIKALRLRRVVPTKRECCAQRRRAAEFANHPLQRATNVFARLGLPSSWPLCRDPQSLGRRKPGDVAGANLHPLPATGIDDVASLPRGHLKCAQVSYPYLAFVIFQRIMYRANEGVQHGTGRFL